MAQKKLKRFAEIETFSNVYQYPVNMPGKWSEVFENNHPITLELACGKGEYALGLGRLYPERNFIGIDLKGNRIWVGARTAIREGLNNILFLRTQIDKLSNYFMPGEVEEIWITFPDPQLKNSKFKKRLTHPRFLRIYQSILQTGGFVHLKTDSPNLYNFTKLVIDLYKLELVEDYDDLYLHKQIPDILRIKTHYESLDIAQSRRVHYLKFKLPASTLEHYDDHLKELIFKNAIERGS